MKLNLILTTFLTATFAVSAFATTNSQLEAFVGKYTLKKAIAGRCSDNAQGVIDEAGNTFTMYVDITGELENYNIFANFDLKYPNSFPKVSVFREGLSGLPVGTTTETFYIGRNELKYSERSYQYFLLVPNIQIDAKATLENDLLTLERQEEYPLLTYGEKSIHTKCVFQKNK